ncbi:hypothetical protein DL93DRAFT_2072673, partial [Clavulina sp. PMI_390]
MKCHKFGRRRHSLQGFDLMYRIDLLPEILSLASRRFNGELPLRESYAVPTLERILLYTKIWISFSREDGDASSPVTPDFKRASSPTPSSSSSTTTTSTSTLVGDDDEVVRSKRPAMGGKRVSFAEEPEVRYFDESPQRTEAEEILAAYIAELYREEWEANELEALMMEIEMDDDAPEEMPPYHSEIIGAQAGTDSCEEVSGRSLETASQASANRGDWTVDCDSFWRNRCTAVPWEAQTAGLGAPLPIPARVRRGWTGSFGDQLERESNVVGATPI